MNTHFDDDRRWHDEGSHAAARAFALDPENAEAHFAHGRFLWTPAGGFENRLALRALERALASQPGTPEYRTWHGLILSAPMASAHVCSRASARMKSGRSDRLATGPTARLQRPPSASVRQ
jgi:hypothetical protein